MTFKEKVWIFQVHFHTILAYYSKGYWLLNYFPLFVLAVNQSHHSATTLLGRNPQSLVQKLRENVHLMLMLLTKSSEFVPASYLLTDNSFSINVQHILAYNGSYDIFREGFFVCFPTNVQPNCAQSPTVFRRQNYLVRFRKRSGFGIK